MTGGASHSDEVRKDVSLGVRLKIWMDELRVNIKIC